MTALIEVAKWVVYLSPFALAQFLIIYHVKSGGNWRHNIAGRHLLIVGGVEFVAFTLIAASTLWPSLGTRQWFLWIYVCSIAAIPASALWRSVIVWQVNRRPTVSSSDRRNQP